MNEGKLFDRMEKAGKVEAKELARKLGVSEAYVSQRTSAYEKLHELYGVKS